MYVPSVLVSFDMQRFASNIVVHSLDREKDTRTGAGSRLRGGYPCGQLCASWISDAILVDMLAGNADRAMSEKIKL